MMKKFLSLILTCAILASSIALLSSCDKPDAGQTTTSDTGGQEQPPELIEGRTLFIYMCGSNLETKQGLAGKNIDEILAANTGDPPYCAFRIPPLTLQPIVENAVKHGMTKSSDPIHISVKTRQTGKSVEIIVEDDGVGFDPARNSDDNDPHIALNNIKERLEMMCKGKLTISQREGGGTSVRITLPKES